jgi:hypothetical protein
LFFSSRLASAKTLAIDRQFVLTFRPWAFASRIARFAVATFFANGFFKDLFLLRLSDGLGFAWAGIRFAGERFTAFAVDRFAVGLGFAAFAGIRFAGDRFAVGLGFATFAGIRFAVGLGFATFAGIRFAAALGFAWAFTGDPASFRPFAATGFALGRFWAFAGVFTGDRLAAGDLPAAFAGVFFTDTGFLTCFFVAIDGWQTGYNHSVPSFDGGENRSTIKGEGERRVTVFPFPLILSPKRSNPTPSEI